MPRRLGTRRLSAARSFSVTRFMTYAPPRFRQSLASRIRSVTRSTSSSNVPTDISLTASNTHISDTNNIQNTTINITDTSACDGGASLATEPLISEQFLLASGSPSRQDTRSLSSLTSHSQTQAYVHPRLSTFSLVSLGWSATCRVFGRVMPYLALPPTVKTRPLARRSLILFSAFLSLAVLFIVQISSSDVSSNGLLFPPEGEGEGLLRYSQAGAHFRKSLTPEQLNAYYERQRLTSENGEQPMNAVSADGLVHNHDQPQSILTASTSSSTVENDEDVLVIRNVSSRYFGSCVVGQDTSCLHASLRRGPDEKELDGRAFAKQPRDYDDVFNVVDQRRYYYHPDRPAVQTVDTLGAGLDSDLDDAITVARSIAERDAQAQIQGVSVPVAYLRTTRRDGWQAIINLGAVVVQNTSDGRPRLSHLRRMVTVTRGYGDRCQVSLVRPREVVRINVLVPYSNRPNRIAAFIKMFASYFASARTDLVRIIVSTSPEEASSVTSAARRHAELTDARFSIITSSGDEFGNFSRAVAIREAAKLVPSDEVIFISDTDLSIGGNFLQNCRVNIVRGSQVWFPVMFSLYPYGRGLSSKDGMWRRSSYGMACLYSSDFQAVGGFGPDEETKFTGWGSEDVFLYNRFRDNKSYAVLRTLEPGLQHLWHGKDCEHNEHYENCMRTVYMTIGSQDAVAKLMVDAQVDVSNLTKNALPV